jgi:hypothetical protein
MSSPAHRRFTQVNQPGLHIEQGPLQVRSRFSKESVSVLLKTVDVRSERREKQPSQIHYHVTHDGHRLSPEDLVPRAGFIFILNIRLPAY